MADMGVTKGEQYFLDKIRQGDERAWSDFIGRYRGRLLRFAHGKLPQRADAEDVIQDTFIAFLNSVSRFRGECDLETYLFALVRRKIIDSYRRIDARRVCLIQDAYESTSTEDSSDVLDQVAGTVATASWYARAEEQHDAHRTVLAEAINDLVDGFKRSLRFRDLQIVELLFYSQLANKRVAQIMNIAEATVGVVKHRSLKHIASFVAHRRGRGGFETRPYETRPDDEIQDPNDESLLTEVWEYHRFSCPKRNTIGAFLLKTLDEDWQRYVDFHLNVLGCRFCRANMEDLEARTAEGGQQLHARIMESTVGFLHRPL
jgi:RNA polymerase sigma factor (sigma-70 family)